MVLDVGSWFREQRDTQADADASALAAAHELPESPGAANALAAEYLGKNGGGTSTVTFSLEALANDTVTVKVTREAPGVFSKLFGINSVDVHAKATRPRRQPRQRAVCRADRRRHQAPACSSAQPLPCFGTPTTLDLEKIGPGAFRLLNLDGSQRRHRRQDRRRLDPAAASTATCRSAGTAPIPARSSTTARSRTR